MTTTFKNEFTSFILTPRYLGTYFDFRLNWQEHVRIMINQARSTLKAFQGRQLNLLPCNRNPNLCSSGLVKRVPPRTPPQPRTQHCRRRFCTTPVEPHHLNGITISPSNS